MCVFVGRASLKETLMVGFSPFFSSVQTPFGPRKSGIPAAVEMPAPGKKEIKNKMLAIFTFTLTCVNDRMLGLAYHIGQLLALLGDRLLGIKCLRSAQNSLVFIRRQTVRIVARHFMNEVDGFLESGELQWVAQLFNFRGM